MPASVRIHGIAIRMKLWLMVPGMFQVADDPSALENSRGALPACCQPTAIDWEVAMPVLRSYHSIAIVAHIPLSTDFCTYRCAHIAPRSYATRTVPQNETGRNSLVALLERKK